jgi:tetratricopeptide (TPR) repeat protein
VYRSRTLIAVFLAAALAACTPADERAANYLAKANDLFESGDLVKAKLEARNAAQIEPKNAEARYLLALIAEKEQEIRPMIQHLLVAVDADPTHVRARLKLGNLMFFGQAFEQSLEQLEALQELDPRNPAVILLAGRHQAQQGDLAAALASFEEAAAIDPDNAEAIILRAASYAEDDVEKALAILDGGIQRLSIEKAKPLREIRQLVLIQDGRLDDAEAGWRSLMNDFPDEPRFQQELARYYAAEGRMDDADAVLRAVAERDPTQVSPRLTYAAFLATQRDVGEAEATLKAFIEETPDAYELRLGLAELYEATGRPDDARATYEELGRLDPRGASGLQARNRLAALLVQSGEMAVARERIEGILRDVSDNPQALLLRAGLNFNERRFQESIADLRVVLRREEGNQRALLLMALSYAQSGERVLAKDTYRRLLDVNPESPDALMQLAALLADEGDFAGARPLLEQRTRLAPDDVLASGRLVEVLIRTDDLAAAEAEARRLAALPEQQGLGDFQLGRAVQASGNWAGAILHYQAAVALRPADPPALEALVNAQSAAGRNADNIPLLEQHIAKYPDQVHAVFLLAATYARDNNIPKAEEYLEQVIAQRPQTPLAYASLASLYREPEADRDRRIAVFRRGLAAIPGNPDLGMLLGTELELGGRYDQAIALYEELVAANPDYDAAINNLAALLLDHRDDAASHERALQLARRFASSDNAAMVDTLGWAYYRNGQYTQAVGLLERAVSRRGDVPVLRYHLGMTYLAMGNDVGARQQLSEALAREDVNFPGVDEARQALVKLQQG